MIINMGNLARYPLAMLIQQFKEPLQGHRLVWVKIAQPSVPTYVCSR